MRALRVLCALTICVVPALAQNAAISSNGWPKELSAGGSRLVVYQPQAESWKDGELRTRSVVMISDAGGKPRYGTITLSAHTKEDQEQGTVTLEGLEVVSGDFPSSTSDQERALGEVRKHLAEWPRTMSLDRLRSEVGIADAEKAGDAVPLKDSPGKVIFSPRRAVLIQVDGDRVFREVEGTKYKRVINTPALILQDTSDQRLYLDGDGRWMTATALEGPWSEAQPAPAALERVKAQVKQAAEAEQQAITDVVDAYYALQMNDQVIRLYQGGYVDDARQSREISEYAYRHGAASLLDFLDAERTYRANQLAYRQALASYMLALEQMRQAVGTRNLP